MFVGWDLWELGGAGWGFSDWRVVREDSRWREMTAEELRHLRRKKSSCWGRGGSRRWSSTHQPASKERRQLAHRPQDTHTHTHTHTQSHTHTHPYVTTSTQAHTHTHTHTRTLAYSQNDPAPARRKSSRRAVQISRTKTAEHSRTKVMEHSRTKACGMLQNQSSQNAPEPKPTHITSSDRSAVRLQCKPRAEWLTDTL